MAEFYYRLRFAFSPLDSLNCETPVFEFALTNGSIVKLKRHNGDGPITAATRLVLSSGPYDSELDASAAGLKRFALIWFAIRWKIGVDLGTNRAAGRASQYLKDAVAANSGMRLEDDVHGLMVYDGPATTRFLYGGPTNLVRGIPIASFREQFEQGLTAAPSLTEKQEISFELFSASKFDSAPRSRFVTLVMAVEALLEFSDREPAARSHVEELIGSTKSAAIPQTEKDSLLGSLEWLLQNSISRTGKLLAERLLVGKLYLGKAPGAFFAYCYGLRSKLVHNGTTGGTSDTIPHDVCELERFVRDLLEADVREHNEHKRQ